MTCFFCKCDMIESTTTHVSDFGNCIIIIRNVPCMKCKQCDETTYTGIIVQHLEKILDKVQKSMTEVIIINYTDKFVA